MLSKLVGAGTTVAPKAVTKAIERLSGRVNKNAALSRVASQAEALGGDAGRPTEAGGRA